MALPAGASHGSIPEEHVVIFRLGGEYYAIEIQAIQEIVRMQSITGIPGADSWVHGITNLRGRVVPVVDLRGRCGLEPAEHTAETRIVVVNSLNGTVGLTVDAVTEVMRIPSDQVELPGSLVSGPTTQYLRGIAKLDDRLISLMDLTKVLPTETEEEAEAAPEAAIAA
jgi:purine-binding chemotaxis protein CheW